MPTDPVKKQHQEEQVAGEWPEVVLSRPTPVADVENYSLWDADFPPMEDEWLCYVPKARLEEVEREREQFKTNAEINRSHERVEYQRRLDLEAQLAECYHLSGADPDGDSDSHLAQHAVQAVRELREESDKRCVEELDLREKAERERDGLQSRADDLERTFWQEVEKKAGRYKERALELGEAEHERDKLQAILTQLVGDEAVEAGAEALWNEREYRDPTGDPPEGWCPPGHDVHQQPPSEPALWAPMVEAGKYPGSQDETRDDARAVVCAALKAAEEEVEAANG